jgi:hypothetical protein
VQNTGIMWSIRALRCIGRNAPELSMGIDKMGERVESLGSASSNPMSPRTSSAHLVDLGASRMMRLRGCLCG